MAENKTPSASPETKHAKALADHLLNEKLETSATVAAYRSGINDVLMQVQGIDGAEERVKNVAQKLDEKNMAQDYGDVEIKNNLGAGVGGINNGLSKDTAVAQQKMKPEELIARTADTAETLDHERSEDRGHAGQSGNLRPVLDAKGEKKEVKTQLEGEVEANQSEHWRGDESAARADQPQETYGDGQQFIAGIGLQKARQYIRKGGEHEGDAVWFQAEVFKKSMMTPEQMRESLEKETRFTHDEIANILQAARPGAAVQEEPVMAMAA